MKIQRTQCCYLAWLVLLFLLFVSMPTATKAANIITTTTTAGNADGERSCEAYNAALEREIDEQMDVNVSPCNDFYEYACGNWRVTYRLRRLGARDTRTLVRAHNKQLLMQHLEATTTTAHSTPTKTTATTTASSKRVSDFYNSCLSMQVSGASRDTIRVYTNILRQFSVWPIIDANFEERNANVTFNWQYVSANLRRYGAQTLWRLLVQTNWQAAEQLIFYIMPPTFDFIKNAANDDDDAFMYQRYIKYLLLDLGVRVRKANAIAEEIVNFERQLYALTTANDHTVVLREPQKLAALARELPELKLGEYFDALLAELPEKSTTYGERLLVVADTTYLRKMQTLLQRTKAETIGKYLLVQFLAHFELHLHEEKTSNEQREYCLQQLNDFMPEELTRIYLGLLHTELSTTTTTTDTKTKPPTMANELAALGLMRNAQTQLNQHFEHVKLQFERAINETTIFEADAETRALGLAKLRAMRLLLPTLDLAQTVEQSNAMPAPMSDNYDENLLQLSKSRALTEFRQLALAQEGHDIGTRQSDYGPLDVNAYYRLKKNAIELPVGILRPPFWHRCLPTARIYGSLVYVLAHELLHGFDYDGINYDKSGNVANNWSAKSIIRYGTRSSCYLMPRYSNATLNLNENIADSEGLRLALEAYKAQAKQKPVNNADLKSLFIGFAQTWCGHAAPTTTVTQHASHSERVNNVLGNFPEFAEVFQCPATSQMQTADMCRIW